MDISITLSKIDLLEKEKINSFLLRDKHKEEGEAERETVGVHKTC